MFRKLPALSNLRQTRPLTSSLIRISSQRRSRTALCRTGNRGQPSRRHMTTTDYDGIIRSPLPNVSIPDATLFHSYVYQRFQQYSERTAIVDGLSGRSYSFKQLDDLTKNVASGLIRRGFQKEDVLCLFLPNLPEYPLALFGAMAAGGTATTANPAYTDRELNFQLKDARAKFLVTIPSLADLAKQAARNSGTVENIFVIDTCLSDIPSGCTGFSELTNGDCRSLPPYVTLSPKSSVALLPYSSGTTGLPKGVMLSHYNLVANVFQIASDHLLLKARPEDKTTLAFLPFFHTYGLIVGLARDLEQGTKVVTMPAFEPEQCLKLLESNAVTRSLMVPPLILFLAKHPIVEKYELSRLTDVVSAGAPLSGEITEAMAKRVGIGTIRQGYGTTETTLVHMSPMEGWKGGSVGIPLPNTECKVIDVESGRRSLGANETGQVYIRGPQVMMGYLNNPAATQDCIDTDNWFHTGDIGYFDSDGHFYITDRVKELIKVKGFQVAPAEIEALLLSHPEIKDAAVIGVPDEWRGEVPKAFVVQREGSTLSVESVMIYVKSRVAPYKELSGGVQFIEAIPKSASGKILRRHLKVQGNR